MSSATKMVASSSVDTSTEDLLEPLDERLQKNELINFTKNEVAGIYKEETIASSVEYKSLLYTGILLHVQEIIGLLSYYALQTSLACPMQDTRSFNRLVLVLATNVICACDKLCERELTVEAASVDETRWAQSKEEKTPIAVTTSNPAHNVLITFCMASLVVFLLSAFKATKKWIWFMAVSIFTLSFLSLVMIIKCLLIATEVNNTPCDGDTDNSQCNSPQQSQPDSSKQHGSATRRCCSVRSGMGSGSNDDGDDDDERKKKEFKLPNAHTAPSGGKKTKRRSKRTGQDCKQPESKETDITQLSIEISGRAQTLPVVRQYTERANFIIVPSISSQSGRQTYQPLLLPKEFPAGAITMMVRERHSSVHFEFWLMMMHVHTQEILMQMIFHRDDSHLNALCLMIAGDDEIILLASRFCSTPRLIRITRQGLHDVRSFRVVFAEVFRCFQRQLLDNGMMLSRIFGRGSLQGGMFVELPILGTPDHSLPVNISIVQDSRRTNLVFPTFLFHIHRQEWVQNTAMGQLTCVPLSMGPVRVESFLLPPALQDSVRVTNRKAFPPTPITYTSTSPTQAVTHPGTSAGGEQLTPSRGMSRTGEQMRRAQTGNAISVTAITTNNNNLTLALNAFKRGLVFPCSFLY